MDNSNYIYEIRNTATGIQGTTDYVVNLGAILYNDRVINLSNLIIPLREQSFFVLPDDKGKYAAVNVYYDPDSGVFVFDIVRKSSVFVQTVSSVAPSNYLPIAQFVLQESYGSYNVLVVNQYSKMSTFSITKSFFQGDRGAQGPVGDTGYAGYTGAQGRVGLGGGMGHTGAQGITGVGAEGAQGAQGTTGVYPAMDLLFYGKFKSDDIRLIDYSVYEQDMIWEAFGAGYIAYGATGVSNETGMFFVSRDPSEFTVEEGLKDNCHNIRYNGGQSSYSSSKFIGFTGSVQAWIRLDTPPGSDFTYTVDPSNSLRLSFADASTFFPTSWEWDLGIGGGFIRTRTFIYVFSSHGTYVVTLRAYNAAGVSERSKAITV
jgi:hypothetical protein